MGFARFITALGLGTAVPIAIALACECTTRRYKELIATLMAMGFGVGVVIGGIASKPLLMHACNFPRSAPTVPCRQLSRGADTYWVTRLDAYKERNTTGLVTVAYLTL